MSKVAKFNDLRKVCFCTISIQGKLKFNIEFKK